MKISRLMRTLLAAGIAALAATAASAQDNKLRLLTWSDYVALQQTARLPDKVGIRHSTCEGMYFFSAVCSRRARRKTRS